MVSDKGTKCPKCGTPIYEIPEKKEENNLNIVYILVAVAIIFVIVIVCFSTSNFREKGNTTMVTKTQSSVEKSVKKVPSENKSPAKKAGPKEVIASSDKAMNTKQEKEVPQKTSAEIFYEYKKMLNTCHKKYEEDGCDYFLTDMNKDSFPEMFILPNINAGPNPHNVIVYTYSNGIKKILEEPGAASDSFYLGKGYVLSIYAHMGYAVWHKISFNGGILEYTYFFSEETDDEYTEPTEPYIQQNPSDNIKPLADWFSQTN